METGLCLPNMVLRLASTRAPVRWLRQMRRIATLLLLAVSASTCVAVKPVTSEQLEQMMAAAHNAPDGQVAAQLGVLQLVAGAEGLGLRLLVRIPEAALLRGQRHPERIGGGDRRGARLPVRRQRVEAVPTQVLGVDDRGERPGRRLRRGRLLSRHGGPWEGLSGGQVWAGLTGGLIAAVLVILLLLTAYFQSARLALVVVSTTPAVIAGVVLARAERRSMRRPIHRRCRG